MPLTSTSKPKANLVAYCMCLMALCIPLDIFAQSSPAVRPEVDALLETLMSDFKVPERQARVEAELASRPDIKQDLFAALDRDYFQKIRQPEVSIYSLRMGALGALALRSDLTEAEQNVITAEMERVFQEPRNTVFSNAGIGLLAHYPSSKHEALVLRFLKRQGSLDYTILAAAKTLSVIGGTESLQAVKALASKLKLQYPKHWFHPELDGYIMAFEKRLAENADKPDSPAGAPSIDPTNSPDGGKPREAFPAHQQDSAKVNKPDSPPAKSSSAVIALLVLLLASVAVILPWLSFRKQRRK